MVPLVALIHGIWRREALKRQAKRLGLEVRAQGRVLYLTGTWRDFEVEISETTQGEGKQPRAFHVVTRIRSPGSGDALPLRRVENGWLEGYRGERLHHEELTRLLDSLVDIARSARD